MSVFENAMKSHNVLENDPYDWEKCDSEDMLTITAAATTAQQLTRLTPAYLGYLRLKKTIHFNSFCLFFLISVWVVSVSHVVFALPSRSVGHVFKCIAAAFFRLQICTVRDP